MTDKSQEQTKVRISMQGLEVEAEGTQQFVESQLPLLLEKMAELQRLNPNPGIPQIIQRGDALPEESGTPKLHVTTNTIASLMNASSGSDLVMAAMAQLNLVQRKDTVARHELLEEMKSAKTFYKDSYSGNLTAYIDRLIKGRRLNLVAKETYSLPHSERQQFEQIIAAA